MEAVVRKGGRWAVAIRLGQCMDGWNCKAGWACKVWMRQVVHLFCSLACEHSIRQ